MQPLPVFGAVHVTCEMSFQKVFSYGVGSWGTLSTYRHIALRKGTRMRDQIATFIRELGNCAHDDVKFAGAATSVFILRRRRPGLRAVPLSGYEESGEFVRKTMRSA